MDLFLYHFYSFSSPVDHVLCDYNYILPVGTDSCVLLFIIIIIMTLQHRKTDR